MSLLNTGVVSLEYDWHIEMIDRQTAMDYINAGGLTAASPLNPPPGVSPPATAGSPPTNVSPPTGVSPPKGTSPPAAGVTSVTPPVAGVSPPTNVSPPTAVPQIPASGSVSKPGRTAANGSSAIGSDSLQQGGSSSPSGSPPVVDASPSPTHKLTAASTGLLPVPRVTSQADAAATYMPFSVSPASGEIAAGTSAEILVKFSPLDVSECFACLYARY